VPFLVHAREVRRIAEEEGHADDLVERAAGRIEDRLDFGQALPRLLHDGPYFLACETERTVSRG